MTLLPYDECRAAAPISRPRIADREKTAANIPHSRVGAAQYRRKYQAPALLPYDEWLASLGIDGPIECDQWSVEC